MKEGKENTTPAEATKEEIDWANKVKRWKNQYGKVYQIFVSIDGEDGEEEVYGILKTPDMATIKAFRSTYAQDELQAQINYVNDTWIDGDERIKTNPIYFLSFCAKAGKILELRETRLVKL